MMRLAAAALVALLSAGCGREAGSGESAEDREAAIYAAVIRHMTSEQGQASGFSVIYVLDRLVGTAENPTETESEGTPIPEPQQTALTEAVSETGRLEFVSDRQSVIGPQAEGGMVQDGGILLTLGPIEGEGERVEVPASSYLANLAGTWQTWVVQRYQNGWRVIGTAGPVAVS
jgi:hypothetical protein